MGQKNKVQEERKALPALLILCLNDTLAWLGLPPRTAGSAECPSCGALASTAPQAPIIPFLPLATSGFQKW